MVNRYLLKGDVTIDESCLRGGQDKVLDKYRSQLKCVTLKRIQERDFKAIINSFGPLERLTLRNLTLKDFFLKITAKVTDLRIIDCKMSSSKTFEDWLEKLSPTLKVLHLDRFDLYSCFVYNPLNNLKQLSVLRLYRMPKGVQLESESLKQLKVVDGGQCEFKLPALEELHFDESWDRYECLNRLGCENTLKSLTLKMFPTEEKYGNISKFKNLERIKILKALDPHKDPTTAVLDSLPNLKTKDVSYWPIPTGDNCPIQKLSNRCIRRILQYLCLEDCIAFGCTKRQINRALNGYQYRKKEFSLDLDKLNRMPIALNTFYTILGEIVTNLTLTDIPMYEFTKLVKFFPYVKVLKMVNLKLRDSQSAHQIPFRLESVEIISCDKRDNFLEPFYRLMNPTLRSLIIGKEFNLRGAYELHNLRELTCELKNPLWDVDKLLQQNKRTLERVTFTAPNGLKRDETTEVQLWKTLQDCSNLKYLSFDVNHLNSRHLSQFALPSLEEVVITSIKSHKQLETYLLRGCPQHIKSLSVPQDLDNLCTVIVNRFPNLTRLVIRDECIQDSPGMTDVMILAQAPKLEVLHLWKTFVAPCMANIIITGCKTLKEIKFACFYTRDAIDQLRDELRAENRTLLFNNGERFWILWPL